MSAAAIIVGMCTLTLTGMTVHRLYFTSTTAAVNGRVEPTLLDGWEALAADGHSRGPTNAKITVVVFSDFECPMCATFATSTYPEFAERHPGQTRLVFRHWPLSQHRFARPAAKAAECAADQGRFEAFHDRIFAEQAQLGLKTFHDFAREAGVLDLPTFDACYADPTPVPSIDRDVKLVTAIGGTGTPTVVINGWLLRGGVDVALLDSISEQFLIQPD